MHDGILLTNGEFLDKLKAHKDNAKHYAFSVFLFNANKELLLQKRAKNKYHSGGLWSNSCCSHFRNINEFNNKETTARNRIFEELGIDYKNKLKQIDIFEYQTAVNNNLFENEVDYLFTGFIGVELPTLKQLFNKHEVEDVRFLSILDLKEQIKKTPDEYTVWLKLILNNKNLMKRLLP